MNHDLPFFLLSMYAEQEEQIPPDTFRRGGYEFFNTTLGWEKRRLARAEIRRKRKIVEAFIEEMEMGAEAAQGLEIACRILATEFSHHPDYNLEWQ